VPGMSSHDPAATIGSVALVGHPTRLEPLIDVALAAYEQIWAVGGTPHAILATTNPGWSA